MNLVKKWKGLSQFLVDENAMSLQKNKSKRAGAILAEAGFTIGTVFWSYGSCFTRIS